MRINDKATVNDNITSHSELNQPAFSLNAAIIRPNSLKLLKAKADKNAVLPRSFSLTKIKKNSINLIGSNNVNTEAITSISTVGNAVKPIDKKKPIKNKSLKLSSDLVISLALV